MALPIRPARRPSGGHALAFATLLTLSAINVAAPAPASAAPVATLPAALTHPLRPLSTVPRHEAPSPDLAVLASEDAQRERDGLAPRFALPSVTALTPANAGAWEPLDAQHQVWRLRINAPGAVSLNLGFTQYRLPKGGRLCLYPASDPARAVTFTDADNEAHGQLWTPIVPGDDLVVELTLHVATLTDYQLEIGAVNVGYRDFAQLAVAKSGTCNIDVVCPEGDPWRDEIQSVAVISTGGSLFCTGFMVNNTAQDAKPYFMTANHCLITAINAPSLVAYWNFQSPTCGLQGGGSLADFQTGSTFRAAYGTSDFTLVELDDAPDPAWNVAYAGWDRGAADPTRATAIHHPNTDEKSISFDYDPLQTTSYLGTTVPGDGSHLRVVDWDLGTTEPGSSGSPLFDQNHHIVGQLHGGYAACDNSESDWYGRLSVSWTGGGTSATRLSDWLDPLSTGRTTLDLYAPYAIGLRVLPGDGLVAAGPLGGPFTPASLAYTLSNLNSAPLVWHAAHAAGWVTVNPDHGTIPVAGAVTVTVALNAFATGLPVGIWGDTVSFVNDTDHLGDTQRTVSIQVGSPSLIYSWPLDTNPGWTMQGQWAFGVPQGVGGLYGPPDPTSGHTGANVLGYNLAGPYANNLPETNLTSPPLDFGGFRTVSLRFWRWLGVEQPAYDHASVRVSVDGVNWTTVWANGSEIADTGWVEQVYDLSAVAARQPAVRLRWTMGTTDPDWNYCGWNLDDISLWGFPLAPVDVPDSPPPARTALLGNTPNPFNPQTEVAFELARAGAVRLTVHDLRGRLVRTLRDGTLPAGRHTVRWDGRDAGGRDAASGTYLLRLEAADARLEGKMVLVR
ncbi:MAG: FlgD immunoglobulin-like domain containing protein [Candidatus Krumholzibacteriia bacterium]